MKKTATIVAFILLFSMLLSSCNYVKDPPEESGTPSATPEETPAETESSKYDIPNKIYHFEPGFTSIEFAKKLLIDTNLSVREIALKLCFADEYYFSNIFKTKTGKTPTEYRRESTKAASAHF